MNQNRQIYNDNIRLTILPLIFSMPGPLQCLQGQPDDLTTRLDLIHQKKNFAQHVMIPIMQKLSEQFKGYRILSKNLSKSAFLGLM